jgi:2-polyprenyl-6-hydroxyphenyl methylase/3-demethylubiquinone-9 3-methyltransferase
MHPAVVFHEKKAREWEDLYARPSFQSRVAVVLALLDGQLERGALWLDAGCGSGFLARKLAERGCAVIGVDASEAMIRAARELTPRGRFDPAPQFEVVPTIERIARRDGTFAGVLCSSVLEYVDDPAMVLREFARLLRPGGCLLLTVPNRSSLARRAESTLFWLTKRLLRRSWPTYRHLSKHHYSRRELTALLASAGFSSEHFAWFGLPPILSWLPWLGMSTAVRAVRQ